MEHLNFFKSKAFIILTYSVAGLIVLLFVFGAGAEVGFRKANHSFRWGENYQKNFGGPRGGFMRDLGRFGKEDFMDAHGTSGQILKIDGQTISIKGKDNVEKIVFVKEDTSIRRFRDTVKMTDLNIGDFMVVIGEPNNAGQIEAKFIRLLPPAPSSIQPTPPSAPNAQ